MGRGERVGRCGGRGEGGERDRRRSEGRECGGEIGGNGGNWRFLCQSNLAMVFGHSVGIGWLGGLNGGPEI